MCLFISIQNQYIYNVRHFILGIKFSEKKIEFGEDFGVKAKHRKEAEGYICFGNISLWKFQTYVLEDSYLRNSANNVHFGCVEQNLSLGKFWAMKSL